MHDALHQLLEAIHCPTTPAGAPITDELFYNDTQGFADFVDTFEQRLQEQNGLLAGRFELFFSATQGEGGWWDTLISGALFEARRQVDHSGSLEPGFLTGPPQTPATFSTSLRMRFVVL
ncbi:MAG: hypothetical protein Q8Q78_19565 [Hydrogenophaga sp.]|nr:hypothetical protein [Hydrogenophaga sp.]